MNGQTRHVNGRRIRLSTRAGYQKWCRLPPAVARWVMLLAALAGLTAMHGLSDHGVGGPVRTAEATSSVAAMRSAQAAAVPATAGESMSATHGYDHTHGRALVDDHGADEGIVEVAGSATDQGVARSARQVGGHGSGHGGHGDPMWLCLAVLAALLVGVAALRHRLPSRAMTATLSDLMQAAVAAVCARARGPAKPDLRLLSSQRC